jgi:hypothetical protein
MRLLPMSATDTLRILLPYKIAEVALSNQERVTKQIPTGDHSRSAATHSRPVLTGKKRTGR